MKKARVDNDPFELEDVLRMGFQNGVAVGHEEHRRIARVGFICTRLILGLGSSCDFIIHAHNQGCKRAQISELVHDAHTLQRAILTPCTNVHTHSAIIFEPKKYLLLFELGQPG